VNFVSPLHVVKTVRIKFTTLQKNGKRSITSTYLVYLPS